MARALVTGAAGQDGGYLCESLLAQGFEVHGLVGPRDEVSPGTHPWLAGVELHSVDVTDPQALRQAVDVGDPDEIYHLAALSSVGRSWEDPVLAAEVNAMAVVHLLEIALQHQHRRGSAVTFMQASSAEIFGSSPEVPQRETTPLRPTNPYGAAKAFAHQLVGVYRLRGLHAVACILYNHESPRRPETFVTRKITASVARIAAGTQQGLVLGDLSIRRDWGWAPDYVDAMQRAARHPEPTDFVVATGQHHSIEEFVDLAFGYVGLDWRDHVTTDPSYARPADVSLQVGQASRARDLLGWHPTKTFRQIVEAMVEADVRAVSGR